MRSHLLHGKVRHRRTRPVEYELEHDVFYVALDLSEIDAVASRLRLFGRNRINILSFRDGDHWLPAATDLQTSVRDHLCAEGLDPAGWRLTLISTPRVLGYQFNPASFYLCRDADGVLQVVIVEVHNTHGERILYTLRPQRAGTGWVDSMDKDLYVSPFIDMDARRVNVESNQNEVFASGYMSATMDKLTLVLLNNQDSAQDFTFTMNGFTSNNIEEYVTTKSTDGTLDKTCEKISSSPTNVSDYQIEIHANSLDREPGQGLDLYVSRDSTKKSKYCQKYQHTTN